jgi:hypothetical protein
LPRCHAFILLWNLPELSPGERVQFPSVFRRRLFHVIHHEQFYGGLALFQP